MQQKSVIVVVVMMMTVMLFVVLLWLLVMFLRFMLPIVSPAVEVVCRFVLDTAVGTDGTARCERGKRYGQEQQP